MSAFSPAEFRALFPVFAHSANQSLVYLDNAATTQKTTMMIQAISEYYGQTHANAHRASHRLARQATALVEDARALSAQFLGAADSRGVLFTRGATEGLNLLAASLGEHLQPNDEILLTTAEHHANLVPWQRIAEKTSAKLRFLPHINGEPDWQALPRCLNEKTRLFSMTAASNVLGFQAPLAAIRRSLDDHAKKHSSVAWILDGAQWAAHLPVQVDEWGCDYFVCSTHKCFGPTGLGLLWGKPGVLDSLSPWQSGGEMITRVYLTHSDYAPAPHRFEPGTASLSAIAAWRALLQERMTWPLDDMRRYEHAMMVYLHESLRKIPNLRLLSQERGASGLPNVGVATFVIDVNDSHAADLAHWLDDEDIAVRSGHLCAQPLLQTLGVSQVTRVSLAPYNLFSDIDQCCQKIAQYVVSLSDQSLQAPPNGVANCSSLLSRRDHFESPDLSDVSLRTLQTLPFGQARLRQLTKWGLKLPKQDNLRSEAFRVEGCESDVWMAVWQAIEPNNAVFGDWGVAIDTDSNILKGLGMALLIAVQEAYGPAAVTCSEQWDKAKVAHVLTSIGLQQFLTPSRANGFWALFRRLQLSLTEENTKQRT